MAVGPATAAARSFTRGVCQPLYLASGGDYVCERFAEPRFYDDRPPATWVMYAREYRPQNRRRPPPPPPRDIPRRSDMFPAAAAAATSR